MIVKVKDYAERSHEVVCVILEGPRSKEKIRVDPFVSYAIECGIHYAETGRSLVGKVFDMDEYFFSGNGAYIPSVFKEIIHTGRVYPKTQQKSHRRRMRHAN